jgi:hypothetical protein
VSEYFKALRFLQDEIDRFAKMGLPELQALSVQDNFSTICHPEGHGSIICGAAAFLRLRTAAESAIFREGYSERMTVENLFDILIDNIVERFLRQGLLINQSSADKLFADSVKSASKALRSTTHLIPCLISDDKEPAEFNIGKIRFRPCQVCLDELLPLFEQYQSEIRATDGNNDILLDDTIKYYKSFDWIAELTIDQADAAASRKIAASAVEVALNFLHMLLGATYSQHLRVCGPSPNVENRGHFAVCDGKICDVEINRSWQDRSLGEGWWQHLSQIGAAAVLPIIGKVVDNSLTLAPAPLARRLIDAAHWYGDASREKFPASQMVKFVIAMERILTTAKEKDLTKTFCDRGSALTTFPHRDHRLDERRRFAKVYEARSRFVHGSSSPSDKKYLILLAESEELSRAVLWSALHFFNQDDRIVDPSVTDKRLGKCFDSLVKLFETRAKWRSLFGTLGKTCKRWVSRVVQKS